MNILKKIKNAIHHRWVMRNADSYANWMRRRGVHIGKNFKIAANGPLQNITIDITRPSLVYIGDNVVINKNFTLVTHDFVSGVFLNVFHDFLPSSGKVTIGNNVRFGVNCTVLKGVTIGDNCFIGAGSVVDTDIPSGSIAIGNPCKVVAEIDSYYRYRQEACKKEAYMYTQSIVQRFGRTPMPADFWEEFPLFVNRSNIQLYPEIPIKRQLGTAYPIWLEKHKSIFNSFEDFLDYALKYQPEKKAISTHLTNNQENIATQNDISEDVLARVRNIVSACVETQLTSKDDMLNMNDIAGWTSLNNIMILQEIEHCFNFVCKQEEILQMTSVYNIAQTVQNHIENNAEAGYHNNPECYAFSPLLRAICSYANTQPSKIAIKISDQEISYAKLYENICKTASILYKLDIRHGDKIILSAHKEIEFIYAYFATHILGATNVIVDPESNVKRLAYIEAEIQPKLCLGYSSELHLSKHYKELGIENEPMLRTTPENVVFTKNDIAEILFTTGTTGSPKGVCLSFANIYGSASNINEYIKNTSEDIELLGLPLCHSFGLGRIRCNLINGATIIILNSFANIQQMFDTIEKEKITGFGIVPAAWAYIRKLSGKNIAKYANQIKYIEIGSAAMPIDVKKELVEIFPNTHICMHYGLTEASRACFLDFQDSPHLDSIGKAASDKVQVYIANESGEEVENGEKGEICIKGNIVMSHYLNPNDSEKAFYGDYFRTGDCGYMSSEGYIYLVGREKELINVGGKKVSPMEVEEAICAIGVKDCICVPMKDPDGIMGELVKCYILKDGTDLTFAQISEKLFGKLEQYKRPAVYEWIDKIPYTESGKKQRVKFNKDE